MAKPTDPPGSGEKKVKTEKELLAISKDMTLSAEERLEALTEIGKLAEERLAGSKNELEIKMQMAELSGNIHEINEAALALQQDELKTRLNNHKTAVAQYQEDKKHWADEVKNGKLTQAQADANIAATEALLKNTQDEIVKENKLLETKEKQVKAYAGISTSVEGTVSGLLGSVDASETFVGKLMAASKAAGGIGGVIKEVGKGFAQALKPANLMAGLMAKMTQSTMAGVWQMDSFRADLAKSGASLEEYGDVMNDARDSNVAAGVGIAQATGAVLALHKGMKSFNTMAKADQKVLTSQVAIFDKLGASAESMVGGIDAMTGAMGMTASEAANANKEIAATASALGESVAGAMEDFAKAAPKLAAHGKASIKVFRQLQTQAKATGMAMDDLLSIAEGFDTYEGAADKVATLNATLGTNLNSSQMLLATESERIAMLKQSLDATGKSFSSMDRWEKKQAAMVLTGGDVVKLGKLMNADLMKHASAAERAAMADDELSKKAANATTAKEKLMLIVERFGVALIPLIDGIHMLVDGVLWFNQITEGWFIPILMAAIGGIWLMVKAQKALVAIQTLKSAFLGPKKVAEKNIELAQTKAHTQAITAQAKATDKLAKAQKKQAQAGSKAAGAAKGGGFLKWLNSFGKILSKNAKGFLAFGATMIMIGIGIAIAAYGVAQFVLAFSGMDVGQILAVTLALAVFMGGIILLAIVMVKAGAPAIGGMLAFGLAFILVGVGVLLAALGVKLLALAFEQLFMIVTPNIMILPQLAAGVFLLGLGLMVLAAGFVALGLVLPFIIVAAVGVGIFAIALFDFGIGAMVAGVGTLMMVAGLTLLVLLTPMLVIFGLALLAAGAGMAMMASSVASLGVMAVFIWPLIFVFEVLTYGILALAAAMAFIKTDDLRAIADIAQGLSSMTIESAVAFGHAMLETKHTVNAMAKEPKAAALLARTTTAFSPAPAGGGGAETVAAPGGGAAAGGAAGGGDRTIVLKLNEREFARAVINILEKTQNLATAQS